MNSRIQCVLVQGLLFLGGLGCRHDASVPRFEPDLEEGVRTKGGSSAALRVQTLMASGQYTEAEALLAEALAAGLLASTTGERLRQRITQLKERDPSKEPRRPPPLVDLHDSDNEGTPAKKPGCWQEAPSLPTCVSLPDAYSFHSPRQALDAMKTRLGEKNLTLHHADVSEKGPCPGLGSHHNVRLKGQRAGSITCCPCCVDTAEGPITWEKCRIVW
jgi:hypothetical protein